MIEYKKLDEIIEFNPKESIAKNQLTKKISMDNLECFTKYIKSYSLEEYNGGMKFRDIAIKSMTGTSGRQRVQLDVVKNTEILVPSYQEQVKIGRILSNIDAKI